MMRHDTEEALRKSEVRLSEAQRIAHIGSWELDLIHNILTWSDEIYRIFEIDPERFGASYEAFLETVHPEDRSAVDFAYTHSVKTRTPYGIDHRLLFPDGRVKYVHEQCETCYDSNGAPIRSVGTVQDITDRKQAEEEIRRLNEGLEQRVAQRTSELEAANQELEAFAYSVSHDLRAPLRAVSGFGELLKKRISGSLDETALHYLDVMIKSGKQMGRLIDDLLSFSRMGRLTMTIQRIDLNRMIKETVEELEPEMAGREIVWAIEPLPEVEGDPILLRLVWTNLVSNALKFTRHQSQGKIEIGTREEKDERVFSIRDNGVGFDMKYADKLFGLFQRLHRPEEFPGTGIGLANVRRIILRHGGRTWAEGKVGEGATFYFSLPLSKPRKGGGDGD